MLRSAYFPIPHRPTFGAPVFRSAYSASRNARASAAFAASIKPYYGHCSKTLDLQPLCGLRKGAEGNPSVCCGSQLPLRRGAEGNPSVCYAASSPYILRTDSALRAAPVVRSAYFPKRVHRTLFSKTLDLQPLCGLRKGAEGNPSVCYSSQLPLHSSHRLSSSSCAGVAAGLFSEKSTPYSFLQNARPSAALRPAKGSRG